MASIVVLVAAVAAEAASYPMKAAQVVRTAPSNSANVMGTVDSRERVEVQCQDQGPTVGGSPLWDYVQYNVDGTNGLKKRGWVPDYYVKTGTTGPLPGVRLSGCPPPITSPTDPGCIPNPVAPDASLVASVGHGRARVTRRYGRTVTARGLLRTSAGAPVSGGRICVATGDIAANGTVSVLGYLNTDATGRFSYALRAGASRTIWFVYRTGQGVATDQVLVRARAPVSLHGSRRSLNNGQTLVMRGSLGAGARQRGVLVELQARRPSRWQTFATIRTNARGRFRYGYRFTATIGVQHYKLRAHVPAQAKYPYAAGASRPIHVRVSG